MLKKVNTSESGLRLAAHDLRNPISGILSAAEYLLEDLPDLGEEHKALLRAIYTSSRFMLRMVDEILERSDSGILHFQIEPTDLISLIKQNLSLNRLACHRKRVDVDLDAYPEAPVILADPPKIFQVIDKLVTNAIRFSYPDSRIEIRVGVRGGRAILSVTDHGVGIPAEDQEAVLRPQRKPAPGLAAARQIVEGHGGQIRLESQLGQGSTFTVTLPLAGAATAAASAKVD